MNKKIVVLVPAVIIAIAATAGYIYYKHNYLEQVSDYYVCEMTPSIVSFDPFGSKRNTEPKFEMKALDGCSSMEDALAETNERFIKRNAAFLTDTYQKFEEFKKAKDQKDRIRSQAQFEAFLQVVSASYTVVCIKHTRNFDPKELIEEISKKGLYKVNAEHYEKKYKLEMDIKTAPYDNEKALELQLKYNMYMHGL